MWMLGVWGFSSCRFAEGVEALLGALGHPPANIQGGVIVAAPAGGSGRCSNLSHGCCWWDRLQLCHPSTWWRGWSRVLVCTHESAEPRRGGSAHIPHVLTPLLSWAASCTGREVFHPSWSIWDEMRCWWGVWLCCTLRWSQFRASYNSFVSRCVRTAGLESSVGFIWTLVGGYDSIHFI